MKKFYVFFAALAGLALASCTNEEIVTQAPVTEPVSQEDVPIVFGSLKSGITRADITGAEAAELLGNQFVVSGYKGSATATVGNIVFDNYAVVYGENTANTTESNSSNWEYVGVDRIKHAIDNGITSQQIKYWDYSKAQYDFIAWSTGKADAVYSAEELASGSVFVSAIDASNRTYTFTGKAADLSGCYIADMVTVKKTGDPGVNTVIGYGTNPVTFKFRQLGTKVRIAIYETVPGYSVKDVKFYSAAAVALKNDETDAKAKLFTTTANSIYTEGTYTVTFPTVDKPGNEDNNQAHVAFAPATTTSGSEVSTVAQATTIDWGALNYTIAEEGEKTKGEVFLGRSSNTASFAGDEANNYYIVYLPNESGTNLNLRVNYTLESIDGSGEEITVKGATAQVPSIYTTWKPGFAYTYIFKISDKTNGYTGAYNPTKPDDTEVNSDPAGLYPITFDAVAVNAEEDGIQETITTVSTPSITTYQKGSNVVNNNEYLAATGPIFVTVNDGTTASTPDLANGKLVKLTTSNAALYTIDDGKTEAEVIDAMQMQDDDAASKTIKGRNGMVMTEAGFKIVTSVEYGVDGNAIALTDAAAMKFTAAAAGTYAFVYTKTPATTDGTVAKYQALDWGGFTGQTKYRYDYKDIAKSHTYNNGTTDVDAYDAQKGALYFKATDGVYAKVNPFIGQGVSNMYLDDTGTTIATGYAKTGTDYYYTVDGGQNYIKAANIDYASFATATYLYTYDSSTKTYNVKPATVKTPADGVAYYRKTTSGTTDVYTYCVILPEQTTGWKEADTTKYVKVGDTETAKVDGMTYFDKYTQNDGVYYAKVIKVQ